MSCGQKLLVVREVQSPYGLYLNFLAPGALPEFNLVPGGVYEGELYFYQGVGALRALPQNMKWLDSTFLLHCVPIYRLPCNLTEQLYRLIRLRRKFLSWWTMSDW